MLSGLLLLLCAAWIAWAMLSPRRGMLLGATMPPLMGFCSLALGYARMDWHGCTVVVAMLLAMRVVLWRWPQLRRLAGEPRPVTARRVRIGAVCGAIAGASLGALLIVPALAADHGSDHVAIVGSVMMLGAVVGIGAGVLFAVGLAEA